MTLALLILLAQAAPDPDAVRASVARSLPYLEKEGEAWIRTRDCLSCHHVPFLLWAHREAQAKGVDVDAAKLAGWVTWAREESAKQRVRLRLTDGGLKALKDDGLPAAVLEKLTKNASRLVGKEEDYLKQVSKVLTPDETAAHRDAAQGRASRESGDGGGLDTMAQLLLGGAFSGQAEVAAPLRARILGMQNKDGAWSPGGQIGRMNRTAEEAAEATTLWTLLALADGEDDASKSGVERARAFLKDRVPGRLLESVAVRVLVENSDAAQQELLARQNADGGWASLKGGASDAFATGQALYALTRAGTRSGDVVARARTYLLKTQGNDGSWAVPPLALTQPDTKPERLQRLEPIYRYWGTAWAAIGLARSLPAKP